jgi:histidine phosphotransferase ChpT
MPDTSVEFASLLCSRLCHDLLSPVGALNNGLELLADEDDPEMRRRVMELLEESARISAAKLKFFRLAFGAGGSVGEMIDVREAREAIEGLFGEKVGLEIGWMLGQPALPKAHIRILLNLALIAGDALVRGGRLDIGAEHGEVAVRVEGPRVVLDADLRRTLIGETDAADVSPRNAPAWLAYVVANEQGGTIVVSDDEPGVLLFGAALPVG